MSEQHQEKPPQNKDSSGKDVMVGAITNAILGAANAAFIIACVVSPTVAAAILVAEVAVFVAASTVKDEKKDLTMSGMTQNKKDQGLGQEKKYQAASQAHQQSFVQQKESVEEKHSIHKL